MQTGGPIAFYEVAATLIPVLLLGGVAIEFAQRRASSGKEGGLDSGSSDEPLVSGIVGGAVLPTFGAIVLIAELVALEAVATGESSKATALVVCGTLAFGIGLAAFRSFQQPWLETGARSHGTGALIVIWLVSIGLAAALMGGLLLAGVGTTPLWKAVAKQPARRLSEAEFQRLWLGHLIATSDFRIARLEAEPGAGRGSAARIARRIQVQRGIQRQECAALKSFAAEADAAQGPTLPTACSPGG